MADETLVLDLDADPFLSELRRTKLLTDKELAGLQADLRKAGSAGKAMGGELAGGMDVAGRSAVKLRGILGTISPELANLAGLVDDTADAFEGLQLIAGGGLGSALSVAAVGAAALGTTYITLTNASEAAAEAQGHVAGALEAAELASARMRAEYGKLNAAIAAFAADGDDLEQQIADINAGTSELEILQRQAAQSVKARSAESMRDAAENVSRLDIEIARREAALRVVSVSSGAYLENYEALKRLRAEQAQAVRTLNDLEAEEARQIENKQAIVEYHYRSAEAAEAEAAAKSRLRQQTAELNEVEEEWINAATYEVLNTHAPLEDLSAMRQRLHDEALAQVQEQAAAQAEAAARIKAAQQEAALSTVDSVAQGMGAISDLLEAQAEKGGENASKLAAAAKGFAIAQLTLTGIQASLAAIAPPPVGYGPTPAGAIAAGVAAAATAGAIAQASAVTPAFNDTPAAMRMQEGGTVRLAPGDYFAAAQKPEDLQRQVGGGGPSTIVVQQVWRGRMIDRVVADTYQRGGKLRRTLGAGQRRKGQANAV